MLPHSPTFHHPIFKKNKLDLKYIEKHENKHTLRLYLNNKNNTVKRLSHQPLTVFNPFKRVKKLDHDRYGEESGELNIYNVMIFIK